MKLDMRRTHEEMAMDAVEPGGMAPSNPLPAVPAAPSDSRNSPMVRVGGRKS
jgi:hypothetical protein